jgi:hypothetical protein
MRAERLTKGGCQILETMVPLSIVVGITHILLLCSPFNFYRCYA